MNDVVPHVTPAHSDADADRLLVNLVSFIEENDASVGVTLAANGLFMVGTLIPSTIYVVEMMKVINAASGSGQALLAEVWSLDREEYLAQAQQYLHLRDVTFYCSGAPMSRPAQPLWRLSIAAIDGFTLGHSE